MSPNSAAGLRISTPSDTTIVLTRTFNAPGRLVWEAMFTPDKMRRWMLPPPGCTLDTIVCEPRAGGTLSIAWKMGESGGLMTLKGVFSEAVPHQRCTHSEKMALPDGQVFCTLVEKHEFAETAGITTMRITQQYDTRDARDAALASGMDEGLEACYQQLERLLGEGNERTSDHPPTILTPTPVRTATGCNVFPDGN